MFFIIRFDDLRSSCLLQRGKHRAAEKAQRMKHCRA
jgi:hypothetical protein